MDKLPNNDQVDRQISQESADLDTISLFYDGDSLISDSDLSQKKSCESTTSMDEHAAKRRCLSKNSSGNWSSSLSRKTCPNLVSHVTPNDGTMSYSMTLKQWLAINPKRYCCDICTDYIARKICAIHHKDDDMSIFLDELKKIVDHGYKFNPVMVNTLMKQCIEHFNMDLHQFVLTKIVNSMPNIDELHQETLENFVKRRLDNVNSQRMGFLHPRSFID